MEEMITETMRQAIKKGLVKSRAIIVDSTHSCSKGNPETPTQILRRMTKTLRKEIYKTQVSLAEHFPEKPIETATIGNEIEYTKLLVAALKDKLSYKSTQKLLARVEEFLDTKVLTTAFSVTYAPQGVLACQRDGKCCVTQT